MRCNSDLTFISCSSVVVFFFSENYKILTLDNTTGMKSTTKNVKINN